MAHRLCVRDGERYLSPRVVVSRLEDEFPYVEVDEQDGRRHVRGIIRQLERIRDMLPLVQKYPSHLQRVLQPAHVMLVEAGLVRDAGFRQHRREWNAEYVLASRAVETARDLP